MELDALKPAPLPPTDDLDEEQEVKNFKFTVEENQAKIGTKTYTVTEVTPEEITIFRKAKVPSLVIKLDGKLYHARVTSHSSITSTPCHLCGVCRHLIASSTEEGGCPKVVAYSRRIDRFDFIKKGYETSFTAKDSFIVMECTSFEKNAPRVKKDIVKEHMSSFID